MAKVRGVSLVGTLRYVEQRFGPDAPARLLAAAGPQIRELLGERGDHLVESSWYDCTAMAGLTREADRIFGRGDLALAREIGRAMAFEDVNRFFKWLLKLAGPKTLFARAGSVWKNYYDSGHYVVEAVDEGHASLRIEAWGGADPVLCKRVEGWIERAIELTLGPKVRAVIRETDHLARDPALTSHRFCRYVADWK